MNDSNELNPEAFGRFLDWLSPDRKIAAERYLEIRRKMVQFFIRKGCPESEKSADTTMDRAAMVYYREPEKYANPEPLWLCLNVARYVWLECGREPKTDSLDRDIQARTLDPFEETKASCLDDCLNRLSAQERKLITDYHRPLRGREKIELRRRMAEENGGANRLRITAYRIRARLRDCVDGCVRSASDNMSGK